MRALREIRILLTMVLISLSLTQCRMAESQVAMGDVDIDGWSEPVTVAYNNANTDALRNLNITLHINRRFKAETIALEITTFTPDSLRYSESVTLPIKETWPNAKATTMDIKLPYRQDVHFGHEGEYIMILRPLQSVVGVEAAGINFELKR
ncbi:MAG: hypothetical protein IIX32_06850 [Alistipes sp.]|nr:hypothetical protein [Alistipes sp.]